MSHTELLDVGSVDCLVQLCYLGRSMRRNLALIIVVALAVGTSPAFASDRAEGGSETGAGAETGGGILPPGFAVATYLTGTAGTLPKFGTRGVYTDHGLAVRYDSPWSGIYGAFDLRASGDGEYVGARAILDIPNYDVYFLIREAGLGFDGRPVSARVGRFPHRDVVESPYSLFVSSRENSAFLYELDYRSDRVRFLTRSVELTRNSVHGYPDKSIVFQTFAVTGERWEVGFQDATVLVPLPDSGEQTSDGTGPLFVPEFFFSPLPGYLTQYILGSGEYPWKQDINYKSLMGFYAAVDGEEARLPWRLEGQVLVDDFNAHAITHPHREHQNPFMGAWMLSGRMDTGVGRFRLSHAGALMYTFQTSGSRNYGYTYYPEISWPRGDERRTFDYRDNYFGFYLGENTLALRADWEHDLPVPPQIGGALALEGGIEYTVSGSKSPANQWGDYSSWRDHGGEGAFGSTRLLDEEVLEHGLALSAGSSISPQVLGGTLTVGISGEMTHWWNVLRRDRAETGSSPEQDLYRPSDDNHTTAVLRLTARMKWPGGTR